MYNNYKNNLKNLFYLIYFPVLIIYLETVLKLTVFKELFNTGLFNMILFSLPIGLIIYIITTIFSEKINKVLFILFTVLLSLIYLVQLLYYQIFSTFFSMYSIIGAGKAMQFSDVLISEIFSNTLYIIIILMPLFGILILNKKLMPIISIKRNMKLKILGIAAFIQILIISLVLSSNSGALSSHYLYSEAFVLDMSVDRFGLLTTSRLDLKNILGSYDIFVGSKKENYVEKNTGTELVYNDLPKETDEEDVSDNTTDSGIQTEVVEEIKYNVMNIDFNNLIENEDNEIIKEMHFYFSQIEPTKQNEYTGMFKGKNLILITAEGFSPYAVNKDVTPTLYKMYNEGFKFTNFYTPIWGVSTSDGEYVACTSIIPKAGIWSFYKSSENSMPFCMGNQLKKQGYETFAYHNHYFDYYSRDLSHPNMGYIYKGLGNGLDVTETWPESDLEMIDVTVPEYIDKQPFHAYYMTVSGHLQYNFVGNYISMKNEDAVKDLNYTNDVKAYLACNIELDKAMNSLINKLEEAGIADDTLIAISPDHYPYGLDISEINELAGHEVETNFELYKGVFLLWSKDIEPVTIDEPCSSLDIIPTISNLMEVDYDSRLLMGRDILSDAEPLVVFCNRSWITDKASFNAETGELKVSSNITLEDDYAEKITKIVKDKFKYSALILDKNYYGIVFNNQ